MEELKFRPLKANEIEVRVGATVKGKSNDGREYTKGFFLLLYKNARVDANILDETVGAWNWQKKFYQVKNTMVCSVGIYNQERKEWIWKDDGGDDDTETEQVKAELSDSFKRASGGSCWGIGRELYYSPKIYIENTDDNTIKSRYSVKVIEYDENKRITNLAIINDKTKEVVFLYGKSAKVSNNGEKQQLNGETKPIEKVQEEKGSIENEDLKTIQEIVAAFESEQSRTNFYKWLDKYFQTMNPETLTKTQGKQVLNRLLGGKK